jgi:hypothetical protein
MLHCTEQQRSVHSQPGTYRKIPFNVKTRTKMYAEIEVSYAKFKPLNQGK